MIFCALWADLIATRFMEQSPPDIAPPAAPPRMSLGARLSNVLAAPGEVFDDVRNSPPTETNWIVPALIVMVLGWLGSALVFSQDSIRFQIREMSEKAIEKQIEKQKMSEAQAQAVRQAAEKFGDVGTKASAVLMPAVMAWVLPFWGGLLIWLIGKFVFKADFSYMKAAEASGLSNMIAALDAIVRTLLIVVTSNIFASPSLMLLVKNWNQENTLHGALGLVNLMSLWLLGVRAMALARLSKVSFTRAAVWIYGIWALYTGAVFGAGVALRTVFAKMHQ